MAGYPTTPGTTPPYGPGTAPGAAAGSQLQGPQPTIPTPAAPKAPAPPATTGPAPLPYLAGDPTFNALVRQLGLSQADAEAMAQQATARVGANLQNNLNQSAFSGQQQRTNIAGGLEARGVSRSGEALRDVTNQRIRQAYQEQQLRQAAANQWADLMTNLALQHQAGDVNLANAGLTAAPGMYVADQTASLA